MTLAAKAAEKQAPYRAESLPQKPQFYLSSRTVDSLCNQNPRRNNLRVFSMQYTFLSCFDAHKKARQIRGIFLRKQNSQKSLQHKKFPRVYFYWYCFLRKIAIAVPFKKSRNQKTYVCLRGACFLPAFVLFLLLLLFQRKFICLLCGFPRFFLCFPR